MGRIGSACLLVSLKSNDRVCFWCCFCICMGKESQKSALLALFHFARVRAASRLHVANYKPCVEEDFLEKTGEKWVWEPRHRMRRTTIIFKLVRAKVEPLALAVSVRSFVRWMPHSDQCVVHRTSNRGSFSVVYSTLIHKEQFISEITKKLMTNTESNFWDIR